MVPQKYWQTRKRLRRFFSDSREAPFAMFFCKRTGQLRSSFLTHMKNSTGRKLRPVEFAVVLI